jgi:hypothetical protein
LAGGVDDGFYPDGIAVDTIDDLIVPMGMYFPCSRLASLPAYPWKIDQAACRFRQQSIHVCGGSRVVASNVFRDVG